MRQGYWKVVYRVISAADVIVEVLDARFPELARIEKIERIIKKNKHLILAINKADLISNEALTKIEHAYSKENYVLLSAKNSKGINNLIRKIKDSSNKNRIRVAIIGYPNTGKSMLINRLSKHARVGTSTESGFTKGMQNISGKEGFRLIDTPGIVPFEDRDEVRLGIISGISPSKLKNPDLVAYELISIFKNNNPLALEQAYGVDTNLEPDEILVEIGKKRNMLKKGGIVDEKRAAIQMLIEWHNGKIRV